MEKAIRGCKKAWDGSYICLSFLGSHVEFTEGDFLPCSSGFTV